LGAIAGSVCDTITAISKVPTRPELNLNLFFDTYLQNLFINASGSSNQKCQLMIFDITGKIMFSDAAILINGYYTKDLAISHFSNGVYTVTLQTDSMKITKRFVKM
jgi:hypothetical protein